MNSFRSTFRRHNGSKSIFFGSSPDIFPPPKKGKVVKCALFVFNVTFFFISRSSSSSIIPPIDFIESTTTHAAADHVMPLQVSGSSRNAISWHWCLTEILELVINDKDQQSRKKKKCLQKNLSP
ncbi:hypothetical protein NPIL_519511 [Nephila pilipes]|uniref:Uncharacterized protein n=1 Tax=Nephila pilipes TaxID=299642 RepID=A0A8X6NFZ6_NEPPI|nr:hypothetical protein NPIL_519511 [Nephila pilipes]